MPRAANYEASLVGAAKQAVCTAKTVEELRQAHSLFFSHRRPKPRYLKRGKFWG